MEDREALQCVQVVQNTTVGHSFIADLRAEHSELEIELCRLLRRVARLAAAPARATSWPTLG